MRICVVSPQWPPVITGGGGVAVYNLVRELSRGNEVTVYTFGVGTLPVEEFVRLGGVVRVVRVFTRDSPRIRTPFDGSKIEEISRLMEFAERASHIISREGYDVVHLHGHFVVPSMARRLRGFVSRIVVTFHALESVIEAEKGAFSSGKNVLRTIIRLEREALECSDIVTVGSRAMALKIAEIHGEEFIKKIHVVHNGVEDHFFSWARREGVIRKLRQMYASGGPMIYNLNRIDPSKGIEYAIRAMPIVSNAVGRVSLVIAGKFEERNKKYLEFLMAEKASVEDRSMASISILRNIDEETKIGLFDAADIFVMTSPTEPFGITILESLARGTPVVVPDAEGPREIFGVEHVPSGGLRRIPAGIMVDFSKPQDRGRMLARGILEALRNIEDLRREARKMREVVKKKYSWREIAKKYLSIYRAGV